MILTQIGLCLLAFGLILPSSATLDYSTLIQCNKGPLQWCENFKTAKQCNAVRHCIQTVWEKQYISEDNDSICQICLDMVKQARDQLQSNETQNDLKQVFEGSCNLIPLKPVKKECIKLADDFIPELIEALSSQMNPQVVCSVAGLCNNAKIDEMLKQYKKIDSHLPKEIPEKYKYGQLTCEKCESVSKIITTKFKIANRDEMLESALNLCGHFSSFSDACANIAITYFNVLYEYLTEHMTADSICHLSGTCVSRYHNHPENVEIPSTEVSPKKDDIPCELCQQLVHHLQEVLTANTTEIEFKMVLEGLCKQTKSFKNECLSLADQYYDKVYNVLTKNLDTLGVCFLIGICPKGSGTFLGQRDIIPLISYVEPANIQTKITKLDTKPSLSYSKEQINSMQLPIDILMVPGNGLSLVNNGQLCTLCEYLLHFIQETLATPATEEEIKETVAHVCTKFPTTLRGNCHNFVDMYGDTIIALLIQGLDPRTVCPEMQMCPKNIEDSKKSEIISKPVVIDSQEDKPTCPLCLLAVKQAQDIIKENRSQKNIKSVLDSLCNHLPHKLKDECVDFIDTYSSELVDMLIADFSPQEICVYIKLCLSQESEELPYIDNENNDESDNLFSPECLLCEKVIAEAEKKIGPEKTKAKIEAVLYHVCDKSGKLSDKCHKFVDMYGDKIAEFLLQEMTPKQICKEIGYCMWVDENLFSDNEYKKTTEIFAIKNQTTVKDPPPCALCELIIAKIEANLNDKSTAEDIKRELENACKTMPSVISEPCDQFVEKYGDMLISLLQTFPPKMICQKLDICQSVHTHINDEVIECGVCHGATSSLMEYIINNKRKLLKAEEMIEVACENLPANYYTKCSELLKYYGKSILNMIYSSTKQPEICANIGKCFKEENSENAFVKIEDDFKNKKTPNINKKAKISSNVPKRQHVV